MICVVSGASSGIGEAVAKQLAKDGHTLVLGARREADLLRVASECLHLGAPGAIPVPCDVTRIEDCERVALAAGSQQPQSEVCLIHCAGAAEFGSTMEMGARGVGELIALNLNGLTNLCCSMLPLLVGDFPGRVISISSVAAVHVFPGAAAYSAAKAGAMQFTACLRAEYRGQGLRVTDLVLGSTNTPIWERKSWVPNKADMLSPEAVAEVIAGLVSAPRDRAVDRLDLLPPLGIL